MTAAPSPPSTRPRRIGGRGLNAFSVTGPVTEAEPVAAHMRRIRIEGDDVTRLTWAPGQQVRVHMSDLLDPHSWRRPRDILRTYSIWRYDGGLELCGLEHDTGGPGARWAREAEVGQPVTFSRPEGSFVLQDDAPYHVFAGEETAAVAFGAMLAALPAARGVAGVAPGGPPGPRAGQPARSGPPARTSPRAGRRLPGR